ncbi:hypothetical protein PtA15_2A180 [Puccinia triticina]|uniref:Uncharacterized protein n=1 Tax=Puccinia triticina TaxID=208348 RepID=A0ABY7CGD5_9BASI|nr:uncharacterized protein PtA15_2A180 [Puccinia triticina]WAQ81867.1 hypothetical protein PtA15_2A180 [Puccinia triticina]
MEPATASDPTNHTATHSNTESDPNSRGSTPPPIDLLSSAPASSTAAPAQGKSASPTNHDRLSATGSPKEPINPWEDGPQELTGKNSSGGAASMHIPQTDTTSLTTPLGNTDKTAGLDLPAPGESLTDPTIAPGSTTVKMTKDAELAPTGRDVASNYSPDPAHEKDKVPAEPLTSGKHQTEPQINCDSLPSAQASGAASVQTLR